MQDEEYTRPDEVEYVGAPTEYADSEEVPEWVETTTKVVFALPTVFAALSALELSLLVVLLMCAAGFVCLLLVL